MFFNLTSVELINTSDRLCNLLKLRVISSLEGGVPITNIDNAVCNEMRSSLSKFANYELDLINYQYKCRINRGWDDLFNKIKEHMNSVAAMKLSPY